MGSEMQPLSEDQLDRLQDFAEEVYTGHGPLAPGQKKIISLGAHFGLRAYTSEMLQVVENDPEKLEGAFVMTGLFDYLERNLGFGEDLHYPVKGALSGVGANVIGSVPGGTISMGSHESLRQELKVDVRATHTVYMDTLEGQKDEVLVGDWESKDLEERDELLDRIAAENQLTEDMDRFRGRFEACLNAHTGDPREGFRYELLRQTNHPYELPTLRFVEVVVDEELGFEVAKTPLNSLVHIIEAVHKARPVAVHWDLLEIMDRQRPENLALEYAHRDATTAYWAQQDGKQSFVYDRATDQYIRPVQD